MNSFGKIVESTRFLAPDGRYCTNRLDALRYMVKENIFSMEDINVMQGGLKVDGWRMDPKLPKGKILTGPTALLVAVFDCLLLRLVHEATERQD